MEKPPGKTPKNRFFISTAGADAQFAAEIGRILEGSGHIVVLQRWDFANRSLIERRQAALAEGSRIVALLSPDYLRSEHCQAEWQNAIANDPLNTKSRLILLRVTECEPPGLLSGFAYWDLVPIRDNRPLLEEIVRDAIREERRDEAPSGVYWRGPRSIVDAESIRPVPSFSGREEELEAISTALSNDGAVVVVHGLGGVGKSSVAREYAWRNRERYSVIWWLDAQTEGGIIDGVLRLGTLFVRGLDRLADRRMAAQQVAISVLSGFPKPVLLVFDNLEDEGLVRAWQPRSGARALVTSRNAAWGAGVTPVPLHTWESETAIGYLQRESGRADLTAGDAREISEILGALPLALAHAAASLRGMRMMTPRRYLEHINEHFKNAPRGVEYPRSVFATFNTAITHAENEAAGAAAILCFAASFAPDAIPDELFRMPIETYPPGLQPSLSDEAPFDLSRATLDLRSALADGMRLDEALGALDRLSLLDFSESSRSYSIHRLVQLAGRDIVDTTAAAWAEGAVAVAEAAFPDVEVATWSQCERLLQHAQAALAALPDEAVFLPLGRLARRCADYLYARGEYEAAEPLAKRSVAISEKAVPADRQEIACAVQGLASIYYSQGRYGEAEPLLTRTLAIREEVLGPDHPDVATTFNDLAILFHKLGRFTEEEPLYVRALAIQERALGPDDAAIATSLDNYSYFCTWQGRHDEAEPMKARALAIREKALGPDHPDVAKSLNSVGHVYYLQKRYEECETLLKRALAVQENALGSNHPDVAYTLNNIAMLCLRQERYEEAEALDRRAISIREKTLGNDHVEVAISLNNLAQLYEAQARLQEAERLHQRVLAIREKRLGADHTDVATSLSDVARMHQAQGRLDEAEPLLARALTIREKAFGPDQRLTQEVREALHKLRSR